MRIVPLEIGRLDSDLMEIIGVPGRALLPIPSWLIEHPRGLVLFDTGMHKNLQTDISRLGTLFQSTVVDFHAGEELTSRLTTAGYAPDDIDYVIFSHLHFDHVGGTAEVPNARLVVQKDEWTAGHHARLVEVGLYDPSEFDIGHDVALIEGVHDLFGDGTIICIPTPGHTRGHQALRVELESGPVVLTGDCVYFAQLLDDMQVPSFGYNKEQQLESMRQLASQRDEGCRLIFGHDLAQFRSLPSAGLV